MIIDAGLALWRENPALLTVREIGKRAGITHATVLHHFGSVEQLRDALAHEAVTRCDAVIVPQLLASRHPATADMDSETRARILSALH
jgi:AcrR family transcriptional regulator